VRHQIDTAVRFPEVPHATKEEPTSTDAITADDQKHTETADPTMSIQTTLHNQEWPPREGDKVRYHGQECTIEDVEHDLGPTTYILRTPLGIQWEVTLDEVEHIDQNPTPTPAADIEASVTGDDRIHYGGQSTGTDENPRNTRSHAPNLEASMMGMTVVDDLSDAIEREREITSCNCPTAYKLKCTCSNVSTWCIYTCDVALADIDRDRN
jgi:hypothetical protein